MKQTFATIIAAIILAGPITSAHAATAFLVHCEGATSVTGRYIYVGTYNYAGQHFQRTFSSWCPSQVEVY